MILDPYSLWIRDRKKGAFNLGLGVRALIISGNVTSVSMVDASFLDIPVYPLIRMIGYKIIRIDFKK